MSGLPPPAPLLPADAALESWRALADALRRIDGWGPGAWREAVGTWRCGPGALVIEIPDDGWRQAVLWLLLPETLLALPADEAGRTASCDWLLRRAAGWAAGAEVAVELRRPGAEVLATTACFPHQGRIALRLDCLLPYAGMGCDSLRFRRFLASLAAFARALAPCPALAQHQLAVRRARALRALLPRLGLCAFLASGSRLARSPAGGPAGRPLRVPRTLAITVDLGRLGRVRGLGLPRGVTALAGAPYHGKSTLLAAIAAGCFDHPPGDGRELVVSEALALPVLADEGRRVKDQSLHPFFAALPGSDAGCFATARASGATSMAATVLQGLAAGCGTLLIDEDSAAANFLSVDHRLRRLLGPAADGHRGLVELLPAFARAGISSVVVAGASAAPLAAADLVLVMERFQPRDATRAARRLMSVARAPVRPLDLPGRSLHDHADRLLGPRHFLEISTGEPDRPRCGEEVLDLRRCGFPADPWLARGAWLAAAWCCRLAGGRATDLGTLGALWREWVRVGGPARLDPYHNAPLAVPPWPLVVAALERLAEPRLFTPSRGGAGGRRARR